MNNSNSQRVKSFSDYKFSPVELLPNSTITFNLDQYDILLFLYTLNYRKSDFIKTKNIRIYFKDMIDCTNDSKVDFLIQVYNKLFNSCIEINREKMEYKIKLFQQFKFVINKKDSNNSYVDIKVSDFIKELLIDFHIFKKSAFTFLTASENIDISKLLFYLQKDRIDCYIYPNENYRKTYSLEYFISIINFNSQNSEKENIEFLMELFKELQREKMIIDTVDYDSKRFVFNIKFLPLNENEIEELVFGDL